MFKGPNDEDQEETPPGHAEKLRALEPVVTKPTREERRELARKKLHNADAEYLVALADYNDLREPGEDDGEDVEDKPRTLGALALQLSPASLRAHPRQRDFLLRDANTGAGVFIRGRVGMLAAAGGSGKSYSLTQLCVAVATGTTWFGPGGWSCDKPRRVLALFGEEDQEELDRRLHFCVRAAGLTSDEDLQLVADNFTAIPLAGHSVALTTRADNGEVLPETGFVNHIRELLYQAMREGRQYDLIVIDPLVRFAGADVETDNAAATRWVQVIESLAAPACGGASVMLSHHTKKKGENDDADSADGIRGASGLVNGVRWAARLEQQKRQEGAADLLTLRVVKANGVPPQFSPLVLIRDQEHEGALRLATREEIDSNDTVSAKFKIRMQALEDVGDRVLAILRDGSTHSRNDLVKLCGGKKNAVLTAIAAMVQDGEIEAVGSGRMSGVCLRFPSVPNAGTESEKAPILPVPPAIGPPLGGP